jgi:hypothetical protein
MILIGEPVLGTRGSAERSASGRGTGVLVHWLDQAVETVFHDSQSKIREPLLQRLSIVPCGPTTLGDVRRYPVVSAGGSGLNTG